jgi:hypothetical protein
MNPYTLALAAQMWVMLARGTPWLASSGALARGRRRLPQSMPLQQVCGSSLARRRASGAAVGCAAVGGPVSAVADTPSPLGCPRLVLGSQRRTDRCGVPQGIRTSGRQGIARHGFLSPMGEATCSNGRCTLPHPSPPGARGRHRLRYASPVPEPGTQPGQAGKECSGWQRSFLQGQAASRLLRKPCKRAAYRWLVAATWPGKWAGVGSWWASGALPLVAVQRRKQAQKKPLAP